MATSVFSAIFEDTATKTNPNKNVRFNPSVKAKITERKSEMIMILIGLIFAIYGVAAHSDSAIIASGLFAIASALNSLQLPRFNEEKPDKHDKTEQ